MTAERRTAAFRAPTAGQLCDREPPAGVQRRADPHVGGAIMYAIPITGGLVRPRETRCAIV